MTERTYTLEDMARAWEEGAEVGWRCSGEGWNSEYPEGEVLYEPTRFREGNDTTPNPYKEMTA